MMIARTVMSELGLGGRFWSKTASAGKDARNVTFKERIGMTLRQAMHGEKRDVSDCREFGCRAWVYLDKQQRASVILTHSICTYKKWMPYMHVYLTNILTYT